MANRLVCLCNLVEDKEINFYLKKDAISAKDIQEITGAGTTCGKCLPEIDQIIDDFKKGKPNNQHEQLKIGF